jgi:hypothetical protein
VLTFADWEQTLEERDSTLFRAIVSHTAFLPTPHSSFLVVLVWPYIPEKMSINQIYSYKK